MRHIFDVEGMGAVECVLSVFDMAQLWSESESRRLAHTVEDISASSLNHVQTSGVPEQRLANAAVNMRFLG